MVYSISYIVYGIGGMVHGISVWNSVEFLI